MRKIDAVLDLSWVYAELAPHYPTLGRPSVDPVLMIRMLIIGYVFGLRSERLLCREVQVSRPGPDLRADFEGKAAPRAMGIHGPEQRNSWNIRPIVSGNKNCQTGTKNERAAFVSKAAGIGHPVTKRGAERSTFVMGLGTAARAGRRRTPGKSSRC